MPNKKRSTKKTTSELMLGIKEAINKKSYFFTAHALTRSKQRNISYLQVIRALKSNSTYHELKKDTYNEEFKTWNYAVRGKSVDDDDLRIILTI